MNKIDEPNNWIDRSRKWLTRNKVFFDVIVIIALTSMSIYVSLTANHIATYQNNIIKEENQPLFIFNITHFPYSNNSLTPATLIEIYNNGKPAYDFTAKSYAFLNIEFFDSKNHKQKKAIIPINTYYSYGEYTGFPTGHMISFSRSNSSITGRKYYLEVINNINDDLDTYLSKENCSAYVYLSTFVRINYIDIYRESHDDIYYVSNKNSFKLSEDDKKYVEDKYKKIYDENSSVNNFDYISPEELMKLFFNSSPEDYLFPSEVDHLITH